MSSERHLRLGRVQSPGPADACLSLAQKRRGRSGLDPPTKKPTGRWARETTVPESGSWKHCPVGSNQPWQRLGEGEAPKMSAPEAEGRRERLQPHGGGTKQAFGERAQQPRPWPFPAPLSVPCIVRDRPCSSTACSRTGSCTFCIDANTEHTHAHTQEPRRPPSSTVAGTDGLAGKPPPPLT